MSYSRLDSFFSSTYAQLRNFIPMVTPIHMLDYILRMDPKIFRLPLPSPKVCISISSCKIRQEYMAL